MQHRAGGAGKGLAMGCMSYIRKAYNVPARRGGRISFDGRCTGVIVAARCGRLFVRFDGQKRTTVLHPTWHVEYLRDHQLRDNTEPGSKRG
jgi:hypothetical protein